MLKKTIEYIDFNEEKVSEDFFFHLSKAELVELEMSHEGGLQEALKRIVKAEDGKAIIAEFKNIILSSYGQRSEDGKRFVKNQILRNEFESTEAYSTLFMELVTDAEKASEFIRGVIPGDLAEEVAKVTALAPIPVETPASEAALAPIPVETPAPEAQWSSNPELVTKATLMVMSREDYIRTQERIRMGEVRLVE